MSRISRLLWAIGTTLTLTVDFAALLVLAFVWNMDLFYYMLMVLILSVLFGAAVVDLTKTTVYTSASLLFSLFVSVGLLSIPSLVLGEFETLELVFSIVSKFFIVGLFPCIPGIIVGCLVGDLMLNRIEPIPT